MNSRVLVSAAGLLAMLSVGAIAQAQPQDHQEHHPGRPQPQAQAAPPAPSATPSPPQSSPSPGQGQMPMGQMPMSQMMQGMPDQCRAMMQNMPQNCMSMMQQMMQGRMGMMPGGMQTQSTNQTAATKAYMEAAERMHGPMMEGMQASDPDVAFVRGMIAHHQGAIDMAKVVLQYGKDDQTKKWASDIIRDQQREITEMQEWLKKNAR
jgi:uncharacterized protein (DUF305 family)